MTREQEKPGEGGPAPRLSDAIEARDDADEKLEQSEELFRLLVHSVKDYAIFMLDPSGRIVSWNPGAQRMKGYDSQEIIGKHFSVFYPEEDIINRKPERELEIAIRDGMVEDEGWRVRKDGTRFFANVVITAVYDRGSTLRGFAKVTRDISERRRADELRRAMMEQREARLRAEEQRRAVEASLQSTRAANRAKDEFLMTLSHELRTPLTSILGWARLLPTLEPEDESFRPAIEAIARAATLQARLLDDVLDTSRIVSGKLRLSPEPVLVGPLVREAVESVRTAVVAKQIDLQIRVDGGTGIVDLDPTRFQQVIWNLLNNAAKFTPAGGRIALEAMRQGDSLIISVTDSGEGIESDLLPHIFEPFRQGESAGTRSHGGLGLGLSIVRYIVESHGGRIRAYSEGAGRGTTFRIDLPARRLSSSVQRDEAVAAIAGDAASHPLRGVRVLVADDDVDGREFVRRTLERAGADVEAVASAPEALKAFGAHPADVVVTDITMSDLDGYALARMLRDHTTPLPPVIALTAFPRRDFTKEDLFAAFLSKPVEPHELVQVVSRQLRDPESA